MSIQVGKWIIQRLYIRQAALSPITLQRYLKYLKTQILLEAEILSRILEAPLQSMDILQTIAMNGRWAEVLENNSK